MSVKASIYIATSLDGFIARKDGSLDWLGNPDAASGEDYGYQAFIDSVDVLVMGRNTFETVLGFGTWPYADKRVIVLSSRPIDFPAGMPASVSCSSQQPAALAQRLEEEGARHLYVDGGITIQRFLAAGLIDEMTITRIPVLLGEGIPLFGPTGGDVPLKHVATRAFDNGYVQSTYRIS
jgi:dihydrofolate reductase